MGYLSQDSAVYSVSLFGRAGVQVFFVISGFVIPYALHSSGYRIRDFGRFLLKRLIRLDPPYLAAILLAIAVAAYHTWMEGTAFEYSVPQLLVHLGYLNVFFRYQWVNAVFWTLGVEVQYYIAIGLLFPLLLRRNLFWFGVAPICLTLASRPTLQLYLFRHLPFFLLGIAAFHYRRGMLSRLQFAVIVIATTLFNLFIGQIIAATPAATLIVAATSVVAALAIATLSFAPRPLVWLGMISYSLYLVHYPIGVLAGNAIRHVFPGLPSLVVVLLTMAQCLAAAWGFYLLIERPSVRWSKRVSYGVAPPRVAGHPSTAEVPA
jgi:peptidoglycan/LPS O-acetylase OafA/YrhL